MKKAFISYNHRDEEYRTGLETALALLRRQGLVELWHDRKIRAGESLSAAIGQQLAAADLFLLLVSADFLASDYCYEIEMRTVMARTDMAIVPIIVRPCDWHAAPFGHLLALPRDGKAISLWHNPDEAWTDVALGLRRLLT